MLSPSNLPSHAQEVGVCVFCNQRSKEPLTPYNFEMVKWMSFRGEWCHRACFEQFRQEHDKFVKVSLGDPSPRCFRVRLAPMPLYKLLSFLGVQEKEFYGKLKGRLFPRVSHAPSLATIESDVSYRNVDNVVLTRSLYVGRGGCASEASEGCVTLLSE